MLLRPPEPTRTATLFPYPTLFRSEFRPGLQRLLIQRVQHGMTGTVGSGAGALRRWAFTVLRRHATKRTLINLAFRGARERHTVMLKLDDRGDGFTCHVLDRILVTEPVGTLDEIDRASCRAGGCRTCRSR